MVPLKLAVRASRNAVVCAYVSLLKIASIAQASGLVGKRTAAKSDDLCLISGTHIVEGENQHCPLPSYVTECARMSTGHTHK